MTWGLLFRLRQTLKGSLWVVPLAGGVVGVLLSFALVHWQIDVPSSMQYSSSTALSVLTAVVSASVGLTGFVVTVAILVVQMATGTFSARYMRIWYRDPVLKAVLAVLVGTFCFAYSLLRRVEGDTVPHFGITLAGIFLGLGVLLFLVLFDQVIHRLRPVKVAELVARAGRASLADIAWAESGADRARSEAELARLRAGEPSLVLRSTRPGAIQAYDLDGLARWAGAHDSTLVLRHATGDFVATGARTVEVFGLHRPSPWEERRLRGMVALGTERTIEQDPAFALRTMVDVAIRALSPAVNDPTTAVQVLDHLEDMLVAIGQTPGLHGRGELRDAGGRLLLVVPAPSWEDLLTLATTEIRQYGVTAIQILRRLRSMLETLRQTVLSEYVDPVEQELARLTATAEGHWGASVDLDRAEGSDRQGIGGPQRIGA